MMKKNLKFRKIEPHNGFCLFTHLTNETSEEDEFCAAVVEGDGERMVDDEGLREGETFEISHRAHHDGCGCGSFDAVLVDIDGGLVNDVTAKRRMNRREISEVGEREKERR